MTWATFPERGYCSRRVGYKIRRRALFLVFLAPYIKRLVPGFWSEGVEMIEKEAEVVRTSEW